MTALSRIPFHGGELIAVRGATPRETLVVLKPIAERIGLDWSTQHRKIAVHPVLGPCMVKVRMQIGAQSRDVAALPLDRLPFWLAGVQTARIPDSDTRERVLRYQREAADVLYSFFFERPAAPGTAPGIAASVAPGITASTAGGVVKGIVHKALGEHLAPLHADLAEQRAAIAAIAAKIDRLAAALSVRAPAPPAEAEPAPSDGFHPVLDYLIDRDIPQKGRRAVVNAVSAQLTWFCAERGYPVRKCDVRGVRLFRADAFAAWEATGGGFFLNAPRPEMSEQGAE